MNPNLWESKKELNFNCNPIIKFLAITFGMSPMKPGGNAWSPFRGSPKYNGPSAAQRVPPAGGSGGAARNLFGRSNSDSSQSGKQD